MSESSLRLLLAPIGLLVALLCGCAAPGPSLVGADRAAVEARFGVAGDRLALPGGGERWLYPRGGLEQEVQAVDFDRTGRVTQVSQVRTAANFARVRIGVDTQADILREFGRPRITQPYPRLGLVGWMFPYVEDGWLNSEMVIFFDARGIVQKLQNGPDPRFLGSGDRR